MIEPPWHSYPSLSPSAIRSQNTLWIMEIWNFKLQTQHPSVKHCWMNDQGQHSMCQLSSYYEFLADQQACNMSSLVKKFTPFAYFLGWLICIAILEWGFHNEFWQNRLPMVPYGRALHQCLTISSLVTMQTGISQHVPFSSSQPNHSLNHACGDLKFQVADTAPQR